jgi:hypothetical protein
MIRKNQNSKRTRFFKLFSFKTDFTIKTKEKDIQLTKLFKTIQLISQKSLKKHKDRNYKYIHVDLVQVGIKPLTKKGSNTSILAVLRDARFYNFQDSLLSSIEFSLYSGHFQDKNIL